MSKEFWERKRALERNVLRDRTLTNAARNVCLLLISRANFDGECRPSLNGIARDAGIHRRTAISCVQALEARGRIAKKIPGNGAKATVYRVLGLSPPQGSGLSPPQGSGLSPPQGSGDFSVGGGENCAEVVAKTALQEDPIKESIEDTDVTFLKFEKLWPKKSNSDSKVKAKKAFDALSLPDKIAAIDGAPNYLESTRASGRYLCDRKTYLQERRWEDQVGASDVKLGRDAPLRRNPTIQAGNLERIWIDKDSDDGELIERYFRRIHGRAAPWRSRNGCSGWDVKLADLEAAKAWRARGYPPSTPLMAGATLAPIKTVPPSKEERSSIALGREESR